MRLSSLVTKRSKGLLSIQWWRFVTPISTRWVHFFETRITYKIIYIFGIRIAKMQTNDPAERR